MLDASAPDRTAVGVPAVQRDALLLRHLSAPRGWQGDRRTARRAKASRTGRPGGRRSGRGRRPHLCSNRHRQRDLELRLHVDHEVADERRPAGATPCSSSHPNTSGQPLSMAAANPSMVTGIRIPTYVCPARCWRDVVQVVLAEPLCLDDRQKRPGRSGAGETSAESRRCQTPIQPGSGGAGTRQRMGALRGYTGANAPGAGLRRRPGRLFLRCGPQLPWCVDTVRGQGRCRLSESGPPSSHGGEWLWGGVVAIVPRAPGLIWVLGLAAGDVMVDGSIRGERPRPLGLWWTAARGRESRQLREPAGRLRVIWGWWAWRNRAGEGQVTGSKASGPSSRSVWKQRRASFRAIVSDARVCESPRALSAR